MDIFTPTTIMSLFLGIGLAASAGFRVFLPLLFLSAVTHFSGDFIQLNEGWKWIGSWPALITLGVASLVELVAYYIPIIDNLLDVIAIPLATIAGTILISSTLIDMGEVATQALAIIAGGGTAATISGAMATTRAVSTGTTGGTGNFLVNTGETAAASVLGMISVIWAPLAFVLVLVCLYLVYRFWRKTKRYLS